MAIDSFEEMAGSELIQNTFLFKGLNFSEAAELSKICQREKRKSGEPVIEENSLGNALYLIENGSVRVVKDADGGQEEIARLGRGEMFGEMSLIENELTSATVIAVTDVELLVIYREVFENLLESNESLALKIYKSFCRTLSERLRKTSAELGSVKKKTHGGK